MKFLRIQCSGWLNSFRQPDFHTYHKTLPLPSKTTIAGMIGSALGLPPEIVNNEWLANDRFKMGIVGNNNGKANDLWQIRKYEEKQIKAYEKGTEATPYKTAVIVRELLYESKFTLYLTFIDDEDFDLVMKGVQNPAWALSLGREDELIKLKSIGTIELEEKENLTYSNTVIPSDLSLIDYDINMDNLENYSNLLSEAPKVIKLPTSFTYNPDTGSREANASQTFSFVFNIPVKLKENRGYFDEELHCSFQIF